MICLPNPHSGFLKMKVELSGREVSVYNGYPLKDKLKALGFRWDVKKGRWWITPPPNKREALQELLDISFEYPLITLSPKRELLRNYQKTAVDFLHKARYALIGDKAGLGKTAETLVYLDEVGYKFVVVCPASVLYNWEMEIRKWTQIDKIQIVKSKQLLDPQSKAYIVSYDTFRRRVKDFMKQSDIEALVCDESHYLKGEKSQRTLAVQLFANSLPLKSIVLLSGTPFLNAPIELFPQLNILYPSEFYNYYDFGIRYSGGHKGYWGWEFKQATNTDELKERMKSFFLGRTKKAVLKELPPVEFTYLPIEEALTEYVQQKKKIREMVDEGRDDLVIRANIFTLRRIVGRIKIPSVIEVVNNILPDKVVVFAVHKEVVSALAEAFNCPYVDGSVPPQKRQEIINKYNESGTVLVISQAMQEGVNLQTASHMVMAERLWNPAKEEQVYSRIHRMGQQNAVTVWIPILKGTLDERIHNMLRNKGEQYAKIFDVDKIPTKELLDFI